MASEPDEPKVWFQFTLTSLNLNSPRRLAATRLAGAGLGLGKGNALGVQKRVCGFQGYERSLWLMKGLEKGKEGLLSWVICELRYLFTAMYLWGILS